MDGGEQVFSDLIKSITQTEDRADEILKEAQIEEKRIIAEAQSQKLQILQQAQEDAAKQADVILRQAEETARMQAQKLKSQMEAECSRISANATENMNQAAAEMMERIVNSYGNR